MSKHMKKLVVHHRTDGHGNYEKCPVVERGIAAVYGDGRVRDHVGDVWWVRRGNDNAFHTIG